jgi:DNA-binding GntR family transcriptional regulator
VIAPELEDTESTKADWLGHRLEQLILSGELAPGTVLRQDDISRRFEVSRTPVREAFRQLTARGLVSFSPNRGVRVRTIDRDEWRQASLARAALEGLLAELAAPHIDDEALAQLDAAAAEFERLTQLLRSDISGDKRDRIAFAWVEANEAFHQVIAAAAQAPFIESLVTDVSRVFSGHQQWTPGSTADRLYAMDLRQHRAIREALAVGNAEGARALARDHVIESWRLLEEILDEAESGES